MTRLSIEYLHRCSSSSIIISVSPLPIQTNASKALKAHEYPSSVHSTSSIPSDRNSPGEVQERAISLQNMCALPEVAEKNTIDEQVGQAYIEHELASCSILYKSPADKVQAYSM